MERFLDIYNASLSEAKDKDKDKGKDTKLFLVIKPTSKKDTAADILVAVDADLLFTKFKDGLQATNIIGVYPNYIEANVAAKKAVGDSSAPNFKSKKKISEASEDSRFIVDMSFYIWAKDKDEALKAAKKIEKQTCDKYDNQCSVDKISLAPFGSLTTKSVWEK